MNEMILIVDDEKSMAQLVKTILAQAGYKTHHAADADAAVAFLKKNAADLALLDIDLPGISGLKLLEMLREEPRTSRLPVIMLTVLGDESHKVKGLGTGADDYLVKPFSGKELLARVHALLRRVQRPSESPSAVLQEGALNVDLNRQEVAIRGKRIRLTSLEFQLLALMMQRKGYVLSYRALSEALSEGGKVMTSESLYAHVKNVRRALGLYGKSIETVHGVGYKFAGL